MTTKLVSIIAATSHDGLIGVDGRLPWHCPADLKWFRTNTVGKAVIMGRKTYESIGKPLPNRRNIVISRTLYSTPDVTVVRSLQDALDLLYPIEEAMIIGGGSIYAEALPLATMLYLTRIPDDLCEDVDPTDSSKELTYFPDVSLDQWRCVYETCQDEVLFSIYSRT